ncbi:MAG: ComEC/Rec2 family competence protein [Verrucomicrobiota bacterium]|nr:ComEC/Rec2 family competence protein [Verrucomicrobiota bacterium]
MTTSTVWPRQPLIGVALAAMVGIGIADLLPHPVVGFVCVAAAAAVALISRRSLATYAFVATCFFTAHALRVTHSPGALLAQELGDAKQALTVRGVVVSEPKASARGMSSFLLRLNALERSGHVQPNRATLMARWPGAVTYGDEVQLFGVVAPVEGPRNPGEFDMRAFLARRDVRTAFVSRYRENGHILGHPGANPIVAAAQKSRRALEAALSRGLEQSLEQRSLITGIVLGLRDETPDEVEEQFQQTGTIHLFAVAGLHVGMVAYLLWIIASVLRIPRRAAICLIVPALFFYAAITGLNTASLRAATMAAVILAGAFLERRVFPLNSLAAAAVLILCYDTQQFFSMGFQLSFAVVSTIILLADRVYAALVNWVRPDPFLPRSLYSAGQRFGQWMWHGIARGASVSLAAWLGSVPLILPYFYLVTPVSPLANVVVVPIAFFVMAVGLMSLLVSPVAISLAVIFNNANWSLATVILGAVGLFARLPAGHFYFGQPHLSTGAEVEITALDLGAGAAIHVRDGGSNWLIDCGSQREFQRIVRNYLRSRGVNRLDGLILTHGDAAHIGAAPNVARVFRPRQIIDNPAPDRSATHRAMIATFDQEHLARRTCAAAEDIAIGRHVSARILFPPNEFKASTADDQALVVQLTIANQTRVLLTSDNGEASERLLLASATPLESDVLIKGQHHSAPSGSAEFLKAVHPQLIVASSVEFPQNEQVKEDWAGDVESRGIKLFRQDQTGAVTLRFYRKRWEAIPFLARDQTFRSDKR